MAILKGKSKTLAKKAPAKAEPVEAHQPEELPKGKIEPMPKYSRQQEAVLGALSLCEDDEQATYYLKKALRVLGESAKKN